MVFILGYIVTQNRTEIKRGNVKIPICVRWTGRVGRRRRRLWRPRSTCPHSGVVGGLSPGGVPVALADRTRPPNRAHGADRGASVRIRVLSTLSEIRRKPRVIKPRGPRISDSYLLNQIIMISTSW